MRGIRLNKDTFSVDVVDHSHTVENCLGLVLNSAKINLMV